MMRIEGKAKTVQSPKIEQVKEPQERSLFLVFALYAALFLVGGAVVAALKLAGLAREYDLAVTTGIYGLLFIPLAYKFDPRIFSRAYWVFPKSAWLGIGIIIVAQLIFESDAAPTPVSRYRFFGAILTAPIVEEALRAVMIVPLMKALGNHAGLIITALLWAWLHDFFWIALSQQIMLSLLFVYTHKSLSAAIAGHTAMNAIAMLHISFSTVSFGGWLVHP